MRLLVCGGRDWDDFDLLSEELDRFAHKHHVEVIIHGGARGADSLAGDWAKRERIPVEVYKADWQTYGKAAGPTRNKRMLVEGKPDYVIAFPGGRGTQNMIEQARRAGIRVLALTSH